MAEAKENRGPLVSVGLMTSGNRAHYIRGVLDSWLSQTFKDFEIVLSDDATTDETQKICEEYAKRDPRIRYFRQKKQLGNPQCYKFVLGEAKGTYFIWASDDDVWDERFLADCVEAYRQDPALTMVFAGMVDVDRSRAVIKELDPAKYMPLAKDLYGRLKAYILFYFEDGKNQLLYGLWRREDILNDPLFGYREKDDHPPFYWGFSNFFIFRSLAKGPAGFVNQLRFFRRSRVPEEQREPRPLIPRLFFSIVHRFAKIFSVPYYWYQIRFIWSIGELSLWGRFRLFLWELYAMARLFFVRKI
jgi:glycosyltransferase involved in cell wall biosynthesis